MKTIKLIILAMVFLVNNIVAQKIKEIPLSLEFENQVEISSLDIMNKKMYVISEGCKSLYEFDLNHIDFTRPNTPVQKISLNIDDEVDIESLALYNNYIFYTDESDNSIGAINLKNTKNDVKITWNKSLPFRRNIHTGLEGLEIDQENNLLYVLQERDKKEIKSTAKLLCYSIENKKNILKLKFKDEISILLDQDFRYTGMALDDDNLIYLIRSKWDGKIGEYYIDEIKLSSDGLFHKKVIDYKYLKTIPLTEEINKVDSSKNSNLEGIGVSEEGYFYLISDNIVSGKSKCYEKSDKKTLLIKMRKEN